MSQLKGLTSNLKVCKLCCARRWFEYIHEGNVGRAAREAYSKTCNLDVCEYIL